MNHKVAAPVPEGITQLQRQFGAQMRVLVAIEPVDGRKGIAF